jgi:predicted  nucleic acid-binding Zn-ribbon protein
MSILDRVTKAVGDVVDRGKKEVDQFVRIQKINGQIGDLERNIVDSGDQIRQRKQKIGEMAVEMLRAGTLASPEMKAVLDEITAIEQNIASVEADIKTKRAEIENIRAEDKAAKEPGPDVGVPVQEPPLPDTGTAERRFCSRCGAPVGTGLFCAQCGSKLA